MEPVGEFVREGETLVWRRKTEGCLRALGLFTALLGLYFFAGGFVGMVFRNWGLGALYGTLGLGMLPFGLFLGFGRSELRVDRQRAARRVTVFVPVKSVSVDLVACRAIVILRGAIAPPTAPRGPSVLLPTVTLGLSLHPGLRAPASGDVFTLASELESEDSDASLGRALAALTSLTGLPVEDRRLPFEQVLANLRAGR